MIRIVMVIAMFLAPIGAVMAQENILGKVFGNDGVVLPGATIVSSSGKYTVAESDGSFELAATEGEDLTVSYLGYDDAVVKVNTGHFMNIVLNMSLNTLLDEAVAIGYGKTTKKEITGSVSTLSSKDFDKGSFSSVSGMLQGKVAGLNVINPNGGDPNASFEILLRGTNTLMAGQGPLIIIDGVAGADIKNINFQEVESIDVLKDGSAAAIYGTRGTNGVIIVTTKRARSGKMSVEYDGQVSVQSILSRVNPMNAEEFKSTIEKYSPSASSSLYGSSTDWFKEITRTPVSHKHSLAVSGGSEKFSHRTVLNIEQNQGIQKKNDVQKYIIRTNIHQEAIKGWVTLDYNLAYVRKDYSNANYDAFRQAFLHNPTEPVYDSENQTYGGYFTVKAMDYLNPVAMVKERKSDNVSDAFNANMRATLNILPVEGLKWDNFLSFNSDRLESREYRTRYYPSNVGENGKAYIGNFNSNDFQWESTIQYSNTFGKHSIQALLGYTYQETNYRMSEMENFGFDFDMFETDNIGSGSALAKGLASMNSSREKNKYISFFGRVMYNYDEKYLASISLRRDGSSRFGKDNKWGWFPAVSLGWRLNKENWLKDVDWLSELKIRAGFGVTGNQDFDNYRSLLLMTPKGHFFYNGEWISAYVPKSNANPNLAWERKNEFNIGVDFAFFDNRFGGIIDYYYRLTTDLLYNYSVPVPPYDYNELFTNVGTICNQGVEITLYGTPVKTNSFQWTTSLTLAHNSNKLIKFTNEEFKNQDYRVGWIPTPVGAYSQRLVEGGSLGTFYGPEWAGINEYTGRDKLKNATNGVVAEEDWSNLGSAYPDLTFGWSNSLTFRNWNLSATFRGQIGGKIFNTYRAVYENITTIGLKNILSSWLDIPNFTGPVTYSSKYLENASFFKLDNLSLSYTFNFKNDILRSLRLYASAQNVFCATAYKGVDPEVSLSGIAPGIEHTSYYPRTRIFTFGLSMTF